MEQKQTLYLTAEAIYRFLLGMDEELETLILCKSHTVNLLTTDQSLYEAFGSVPEKNETLDYNKLVKLLEVTTVKSFEESMQSKRTILSEDRVQEVRNKAGEKSENHPTDSG